MQKQFPRQRESKYSESGKRIHHAICIGSMDGLSIAESNTYELLKQREAKAVVQFFGENAVKVTRIVREERLWMQAGDYEHSGQADVIFTYGFRSLIIDFKSGFSEVQDSSVNEQLRDLVVLYDENNPRISEEIGVCVIRGSDKPESNVDITVYDADAIDESFKETVSRVRSSNYAYSPRIPGVIQCQYCSAINDCPERAKWVASMSPVPINKIPPSLWKAEQWERFFDARDIIKAWIVDVEAYAKDALAKDAAAVPGCKLKNTGSIMSVTDIHELANRYRKLGGTLEMFIQLMDLRKGDFEQSIRALTGASGAEFEKALETIYKDVTSTKEKSKSLQRIK